MITNKAKRARALTINELYEACKGLIEAKENGNKDFISLRFPKPMSISLKYKFDTGYRMIDINIEEIWVDLLYQEATIFDRNPGDRVMFEWSSNKTALAYLRNLVDAIRLYQYL